MSETKLFTLRMPSDLLREIDDAAQIENRSRAQVIVMALQSHFQPAVSRSRVPRTPAVKPAPVPKPDPLDIPGVVRGSEVEAPTEKPQSWITHDPATCRLIGCGWCKVIKGDKHGS